MKGIRAATGPIQYITVIPKRGSEIDRAIYSLAAHDGMLGLDIETAKLPQYSYAAKAGLDPYLSEVRLIQIYQGKVSYVFDTRLFAESAVDLMRELLSTGRFIAHNGCFELKMLKHHFNLESFNIDCSMLLAMLVDRAEHSPFEPDELEEIDEEEKQKGNHKYKKRGGYGLDNVTATYFGIQVDKTFQVSDWGKDKLSTEQLAYAALDAVLPYELGKVLIPKIKTYKMVKAYRLLRDMQHVIGEMAKNGFGFDAKSHLDLTFRWGKEVRSHRKECLKHYPGVNLNSPKQLNEWLEGNESLCRWVNQQYRQGKVEPWPKSEKSGYYSFSRNKIIAYDARQEIAALLKYRKSHKLFSTYGEALFSKIHPVTKRIHCDFFLGETRTGRLSARDPNLQNMPRDSEMRKVFKAAKGHSLVVADFSQIEMRVAGELSKDPTMLKAFAKGIDLHKAVVCAISSKKYKDITDDERQLGKAINFGLLFGMGPKKLRLYAKISYGVTLSEDQAYEAWRTFHENMYPKYSAWCDVQRAYCERLGYVRTPMGKVRKLLPEEAYTRAINTPVQGGAAEVAYCSLVKLRERIGFGAHIVNMVHDEIILEVKKGQEVRYGGLLVECMEFGMKEVFSKANTFQLAEAFYGDTWYEAKNKETRKSCR